ncbi:unnamed protein product [Psylliodes chrysocephalus]|uniref:Uncharacterized protein n=1 Tax=Psylliodes chrysocephalus TaxID=3402493 RepID=A0A9P0CTC8_9CUCU|nr:unnamed protein product [Psylliodes chrysocephala]
MLIMSLSFGIYNYLYTLQNKLATEEGKIFRLNLMQSVKQRLFPYKTRLILKISTILDPRFKTEGFRNVENTDSALKLLDNEISFFINKNKEQKEVEIDKEIKIGTDVTSESTSLFSFI